ncbi:Adka protein [Neoconidiobolus thromboides FSU 785]|nr:Adka protein [Neoconidiobolus thromboides FSU 785]
MGNPLLDICATVGEDVLSKYDLKANDAILAEDKHAPLYKEVAEMEGSYCIAGGATQNTCRGAQRLLPPNSVNFIGCVSNDKFAETLKQAAERDGLHPNYYIDETIPTGTCATLINGHNRSLVANLSAANNYKVSHLEKAENWAYVEKAKFFYNAGFFLTVSIESILKVAKHANENNKVYAMNLSAPFLSQFFKDNMDAVSPYWDIIFGNETEALAYSQSHGYETEDIKEIALKIANLPKENKSRPRLVVFTQGTKPTIVVENGQVKEFPINEIDPKEINDTNGAGDAFVGGFISQYVQGASVERCVHTGHWLAGVIIRQPGSFYPEGELIPPSN